MIVTIQASAAKPSTLRLPWFKLKKEEKQNRWKRWNQEKKITLQIKIADQIRRKRKKHTG